MWFWELIILSKLEGIHILHLINHNSTVTYTTDPMDYQLFMLHMYRLYEIMMSLLV